jgi:hypothetical protein
MGKAKWGWLLALALLAGPVLAGGSLGPKAGDRVLAQWEADGLWYPARITGVNGREVHVAYDDGDIAVVGALQVRSVDWSAGTRVQCNWRNQGRYYDGTITVRAGERIDVDYDDGTRETITIARCRSG